MSNILPYVAVLTSLFVFLSVRIIKLRRTLKIGLGDVGNDQMLRAMRVHANFSEYVPLSILLIYLVEQQNVNAVFVHILCGLLVLSRLLHAYGVSQTKENFRFRIAGMAMTFSVLLISSAYLLFVYITLRV